MASATAMVLAVGQNKLLKVEVIDQQSEPFEQDHLKGPVAPTFVSSDTTVATVDPIKGIVTGIAAGSANITASYTDSGGNEATAAIACTVYVAQATTMYFVQPT